VGAATHDLIVLGAGSGGIGTAIRAARYGAKVAVLDGNRIEFTLNGERYEWLSSESILPNGGTWNLWLLHDTNYTPLFGPAVAPPRSTQKGPNVFEKIEGALSNRGAEVTFNLPGRSGPNKTATTIAPQRVMVGGADSMENLLPKSGP